MDQEPDRSAPNEDPDQRSGDQPAERTEDPSPLLQELVAYLRDSRTELREEWARRISEAELLGVMSDEEIFSEATEVFDNYVDALETGSIETLQTYARELSERIIPRGVETHEVLGIVLLLRDVLARSLFAKYQDDLELLNRILDEYEPAANRIAASRTTTYRIAIALVIITASRIITPGTNAAWNSVADGLAEHQTDDDVGDRRRDQDAGAGARGDQRARIVLGVSFLLQPIHGDAADGCRIGRVRARDAGEQPASHTRSPFRSPNGS